MDTQPPAQRLTAGRAIEAVRRQRHDRVDEVEAQRLVDAEAFEVGGEEVLEWRVSLPA